MSNYQSITQLTAEHWKWWHSLSHEWQWILSEHIYNAEETQENGAYFWLDEPKQHALGQPEDLLRVINDIDCLKVTFGRHYPHSELIDFSMMPNLKIISIVQACYTEQELLKLKTAKNLERIHIHKYHIENFPDISDLQHLEHLKLYNVNLSDFSNIAKLTNLKTLNLDINAIETLDGIENLKKLEQLSIFGCPVEDVSMLNNLEKLKYLDVSSSNIKDPSLFNNLKQLNTLRITHTPMSMDERKKVKQQLPDCHVDIDFLEFISPSDEMDDFTRAFIKEFGFPNND